MRLWYLILMMAALAGCSNNGTPIVTGYEGKPMPDFVALKMDSSTQLNTASIPTGKPVIMFLFSPYCPYCRAQTEDIIKNARKFENVRLYLVSPFPFSVIKDYEKQFHLSGYPGITVIQDTRGAFGAYYKAQGVPFIAVYNKNKMLKQVLMGKTAVSTIRKAVFD